MKKRFSLPLLTALTALPLLLTGCASIMSGSVQTVKIATEPEDAQMVMTNKAGEVVCKAQTPLLVNLKKSRGYFKGETYTVKLNKAGYKEQSFVIDSQPSGWYIAGNLVFGGLIGWLAVDPATGAMFTLSPDEVNIKLVPEDNE